MSASMELPARNQSSPAKGSSVDRPRSSGGNPDSAKKKGFGLKEMEATVSTLHKQNFDLKLELFHRRERQSVLEDRIEALEVEKAQVDDVNDKLLDELEKRDKAVQEAVQMIVALEAQVETLLQEREMVRQVDAAGYPPPNDIESRLNGPTPKPKIADLAQLEEDAKALNRMPSFMSDRTENTENLRKVYLSSRGSILSLPRITTEGVEDNDGRRMNSLTSPSLSVLSESSFTSVYGEREDQDETIVADPEEPPTMDGTSLHSEPRKLSLGGDLTQLHRPVAMAPMRPDRSSRSSSLSRVPGPGQFQSIHDIIGHSSPLQKLARLDPSCLDKSPTQEHFSFANRGQTHKYVKDAKRETMRRVVTDDPMARSSEHTLPPTPDTISTSTLRRFKNSNDTLSRQRNVSGQSSYPSVSDGTSRGDDADHMGGAPVFESPLVSAFGNGPVSAALSSAFDTRPPLISRPRSAGESTVSRRGPDWESDSESVHSLDSSLDIWLQQGKEPKGYDRSDSPDLFNFPPSGGGWAPQTMFGSSGGTYSVPRLAQQATNPVEDLMSAQEALFPDAVHPPPAPNRRSSLGAKTGPTSRDSPVHGKLRKSPSRSGSRRNSSVDAQTLQVSQSGAHTPQQSESKAASRSKDNHYPPASGSTPRGHRLNFFRRSIGGGSALPMVEVDEVPQSASAAPMGVPSWVQRGNLADGERTSATPPPIMRNPRQGRAVSVDEGAPIHDRPPMTPTTPAPHHTTLTPVSKGSASGETTPTSNNASGGAPLNKRKWLPGFSRTSSLRNRAG
ncbi:hypothetical protein CGCF415_v013680 [Colletotrichum fructicola]|nr:hypothetical protein CGCF415_v013680 [Colletotrichum fructicola]KAF5508985.1 hypothetical protein CGCF413_v002583 [Colletotrichum fructicola]